MKKWIYLFLAFMLLVSCRCGINHIFPSEYRLVKETKITCFPDEITVYNIIGNINMDSIENYPVMYRDKYKIQKWVDLNMLNDKDLIKSIVRNIIENLNKENVTDSELEVAFNSNTSFYFSGFYSLMDKTRLDGGFRFYDDFYLLDIKNKRLYRIKDINKNY